MNRRRFIEWLMASGGAAALGIQGCEPGLRKLKRMGQPNIIYILADDLGYRELGCYGQEKIRTPHIDRLAAEGIRFLQHYSGSPVCAPSRCTLMTGKHTGHAYVRDNHEIGEWESGLGQLPLSDSEVTIPEILKTKGYTTGMIGKWGLGGSGTSGDPNRQGFDFFYGYIDQRKAHNYYPEYLWRNGEKEFLNNRVFSAHQKFEGDPDDPADYDKYKGNDYSQDLMAAEALKFIEANQDRPFFLYLPFTIPHLALQVPDEELEQYADWDEEAYLFGNSYLPQMKPRAAYAAMITRMDRQIGEIMKLLKRLGLDERTLVMFSSDNGTTYLRQVDYPFFNSLGNLRGFKGSVYEGGIRVPFIARWPGMIAPGTTSDHLSAFWDILPTLAELTGARIPEHTDGLSLLPTLLGRKNQRHHEYLYWEFRPRGQQAVRYGKWKGVRMDIINHPDAPIALYDLERDVGETTDVSAVHPEIVNRIASFIQEAHIHSEIFPLKE